MHPVSPADAPYNVPPWLRSSSPHPARSPLCRYQEPGTVGYPDRFSEPPVCQKSLAHSPLSVTRGPEARIVCARGFAGCQGSWAEPLARGLYSLPRHSCATAPEPCSPAPRGCLMASNSTQRLLVSLEGPCTTAPAHASRAPRHASPTAFRSRVSCSLSNPLRTSKPTPPSPTSTGATMTMPLERRSRRRRLREVDVSSMFIKVIVIIQYFCRFGQLNTRLRIRPGARCEQYQAKG